MSRGKWSIFLVVMAPDGTLHMFIYIYFNCTFIVQALTAGSTKKRFLQVYYMCSNVHHVTKSPLRQLKLHIAVPLMTTKMTFLACS